MRAVCGNSFYAEVLFILYKISTAIFHLTGF